MKASDILLKGYDGLESRCVDDEERKSLPHWTLGVVSGMLSPEEARHVLEVVETCLKGERMRRREEGRRDARRVGQ